MIEKELFKHILVPVDGSHSCLHAKMLASSIAKKFNSKVTVVHVVSHEFMHPELKAQYQLPNSIIHKIDDAYMQAGKKIIRTAEELFREAGVPVQSKLVTHEDPAEFLLEMVKGKDCSLVIIGNRAETQSERHSLGSITEKIARHAECPVLIVKRKPKIEKLLVAVDGSKYSDKALEFAAQIAKHYSADLALVHVEEDKLIRIGGPQVVDCLGTVGECILKDASKKVNGIPSRKMLEYGSPAEVIIKIAKKIISTSFQYLNIGVKRFPAEVIIKIAKKADVDIIVMGSRGLSSVRRFLLGSVSDDISMHSRNSVLIVK
jgi:nucleotide-binding universal stress UspA family protein